MMMMMAFDWQPRFDPILFALGIIAHIAVAHRRQFTGGIFGCVSGRALAVDDYLFALIRQKFRRKLSHLVRRQIDSAGQVRVIVSMRGERFDQLELIFSINLLFQFLARDGG